ncbi:MAG: ribosome small subunit-dependent GTPase A [Cyanobacteria bacterium P01_F01_bin.3]
MKLEDLGWSETFAHSFECWIEPHASKDYQVGRVAIAHRSQYHLYTERGNAKATLTGKFRHQAQTTEDFPAVGDWVVVRPQPETPQYLIDAVLPRRSQIVRQASGTRTTAQLIATNIDTLFLVSGLDHDFNLRRIERYLSLAWKSGAQPVVILNKADVCVNIEEKQKAVEESAIAVPVIPLSALHQDNLTALNPYLNPGKTVALLGSSGVGKSTLTNQLLGKEQQSTQAVREDDSRGRHTTTHREMLILPSGALLIDTPGMRELQLWSTDQTTDQGSGSLNLWEGAESGIEETFQDIEKLAAQCRFRNCQHGSEPGCAIQAAIDSGELSHKRWNSYQKLQREQAYQHRRQDKQAQSNAKARWKHITKTVRQNRKGWQ